jgi:hypothetical protein
MEQGLCRQQYECAWKYRSDQHDRDECEVLFKCFAFPGLMGLLLARGN